MSFYQNLNPSLNQHLSIDELKELVKAKPYVNEYKILLAQLTSDTSLIEKAMPGVNLLQNFVNISSNSQVTYIGTTQSFEKESLKQSREHELTDWVEENIDDNKIALSLDQISTSSSSKKEDDSIANDLATTSNEALNETVEELNSAKDLLPTTLQKSDIKASDQENEPISEPEHITDDSLNPIPQYVELTKQEVLDSEETTSINLLTDQFKTRVDSIEVQTKEENPKDIDLVTFKANEKTEPFPKGKRSKKKIKEIDLKFINQDFGESDEFEAWLMSFKPIEGGNVELIKTFKKKKKKSKVEIIAKNSIEKSEEIISEGLANILLKQGHFEEAISMYRKLILNFPDKSAYFALQIEKIKN